MTDKATSPLARILLNPGFPVVIFLVFLTLASILHSGLTHQDDSRIRASLATETMAVARQLERELAAHADAIRRMAARLNASPDMKEPVWRADALANIRDFGSFHAIGWIDPDFHIRRVAPATGNKHLIGYNVASSEQRRQALEAARRNGHYDLSGIIDLKPGGQGLVIYAPIGSGDQNRGFIAGAIRMEALTRQLLEQRFLEAFRIRLRDQGRLDYLLNQSDNIHTGLSHTETVNLPPLTWSVTLAPTQQWVREHHSRWPMLTFFSMLIMGLITSLTALLVQLILKRNQVLLKTRRDLDREIRERKRIQQDLARLESTDPLTGLANRRFFMDDLAHTLSIADRQMRQVALIMLDLDRFQTLNDSLGHQFGDELLIRVAKRLNRLSNERVLVAYSGGDEFMLCQQQLDTIDDVISLIGQIRHCFEAPFLIHGQEHRITATLGVAVYPRSGLDADTLLRNADIALYRAKELGRNSYQFYTEGMQEREVRRLQLDRDLTQALANNELSLHYQPQLNLETGAIDSVEALIRWHHPRRGLVPPAEFIPLAEENGRITDIGRWVIRTACAQLAHWQGTPCEHLRIAINLSAKELESSDLVDHIRHSLHASGIDPGRMEIELTEESYIRNIEHNHRQLAHLRELGVHLAIDDFGVGYSSLGYLRNFPVNVLKIDRTFITDVPRRHDSRVITGAVISLAHSLGIRVIAEGVETGEQMDFLRQHRCNLAQGYLISRPMPATELEQALSTGTLSAGPEDKRL